MIVCRLISTRPMLRLACVQEKKVTSLWRPLAMIYRQAPAINPQKPANVLNPLMTQQFYANNLFQFHWYWPLSSQKTLQRSELRYRYNIREEETQVQQQNNRLTPEPFYQRMVERNTYRFGPGYSMNYQYFMTHVKPASTQSFSLSSNNLYKNKEHKDINVFEGHSTRSYFSNKSMSISFVQKKYITCQYINSRYGHHFGGVNNKQNMIFSPREKTTNRFLYRHSHQGGFSKIQANHSRQFDRYQYSLTSQYSRFNTSINLRNKKHLFGVNPTEKNAYIKTKNTHLFKIDEAKVIGKTTTFESNIYRKRKYLDYAERKLYTGSPAEVVYKKNLEMSNAQEQIPVVPAVEPQAAVEIDISKISRQVMREIKKRQRVELERRGML